MSEHVHGKVRHGEEIHVVGRGLCRGEGICVLIVCACVYVYMRVSGVCACAYICMCICVQVSNQK